MTSASVPLLMSKKMTTKPDLFTLTAILAATCLLGTPNLRSDDSMSPHASWTNVAVEKPVQFARPPNDSDVSAADVADDARQLVDRLFSPADPIWYDKEGRSPVGWTGGELIEFTVDLGQVEPIRGVALRVGAGKNGVAWPKYIKVSVSDDGKSFGLAGDLMQLTPNPPAPDQYATVWLEAEDLKTHGRFVKFSVAPTDSGQGTYFYTDELEIYRGEEAWLSLPLPGPEKIAKTNSPRPQWENIATDATVQLDAAPSDPAVTGEDDEKQLVDGVLATAVPLWADKAAVGWVGSKMVEFTVDLGKDQPIRGVALHMAAGQSGVEWPTAIEVYVSETGSDFTPLGDLMLLMAERPPEGEYSASWLVAEKLETHGRYIKFVFSPTNLGNGAYVYLDEVEVYRGEDAFLSKPLTGVPKPEKWTADWKRITWRVQADTIPDAEQPKRVILHDGKTSTGADRPLQRTTTGPKGQHFTLLGEAGKPRSMAWIGRLPEPISTEKCRNVRVTFRADGMRRTYEPYPVIVLQGVNSRSSESEVTLIEANMMLNDGRSHTLVKQLPEGFTFNQIRAAIPTDSDAPGLTIESLELLGEMPEIFNQEIVADAPKSWDGFVSVDLGTLRNGSLAQWFDRVISKHKVALDGVRTLSGRDVTVSGAPFRIAGGEKNLAVMPESLPVDGQVTFLGEKVDRRYLDPASRDDKLSVDVDAKACEVHLLLALSASPLQIRGGLQHTALRLDDIESISVGLAYEDGTEEVAFPYSLADKACFVPARELGAYAVAVDPARRLKKVTIHNRHFGPAFALAGLTLNTSDKPLVPELSHIPPPVITKVNPEPPARPVELVRQGNRLTFGNRWYEFGFDLSNGFVLDRLVNRWNASAPVQLDATSGLRVRVGGNVYTGRCFRTEIVRVTKTSAELKLSSTLSDLPLEVLVTITANESPELAFSVETINRGEKPLAAEISLPAVSGLILGNPANTRMFFPQFRVVDTGEDIALRAPYGPEFSSQFLDIYNRPEGIGLMVRTDNKEQAMVDFALRKDVGGVSGGVWYPASYNQLSPGEKKLHPTVSLIAHGGDWHGAFDLYRNWIRTWYKPYKAQDKEYFLKAWDIACYRTSTTVSWSDSRIPAILSPGRDQFHFDETFAFEKQRLGHVPDLIHFFNWTFNDAKNRNEYGVASGPLAYAQVGGLEFFRKSIDEVQSKWQRPLSLYTVADRFRASALPSPELADQLTKTAVHQILDTDSSNLVRASGAAADGIIFPKLGNPAWMDFFINDILTMQKDTGCTMVYLDVFPHFSHLPVFQGSPRSADLEIARRLREGLPANVAFWSEYVLTDYASQYADGALHYYFLDLYQVFARRYNQSDRADSLFFELPLNIGRYALPRYKSFGLPVYIEAGNKPSQVDAIFVNGEAFQEDTYRLHHSRIRERLNRAYDIKRKYTDCFTSDDPVPQVETMASGVVANVFPGDKRKVWTLYNGRPKTYSGLVLEVPHQAGAKYRDAWGDRELHPAIENGVARISLTLDVQQPGCVVQDWSGGAGLAHKENGR